MDSIIEQLNANLKIVYRQALDADKKLDDFINVIAGQVVSINLNISFD